MKHNMQYVCSYEAYKMMPLAFWQKVKTISQWQCTFDLHEYVLLNPIAASFKYMLMMLEMSTYLKKGYD